MVFFKLCVMWVWIKAFDYVIVINNDKSWRMSVSLLKELNFYGKFSCLKILRMNIEYFFTSVRTWKNIFPVLCVYKTEFFKFRYFFKQGIFNWKLFELKHPEKFIVFFLFFFVWYLLIQFNNSSCFLSGWFFNFFPDIENAKKYK